MPDNMAINGMEMTCGKIRQTLLASSNLEILTPELAQAKAHLHECAECRAFLQQHEALRRFLKERLRREKAPVTIREEVLRTISRRQLQETHPLRNRTRGLARYALAAAVLLAVVLSIFYFMAPFRPNTHEPHLTAELIDDHIRYRLSTHAIEQATNDPTTLNQWLNSRLDFVARIPPIAGFELAGGRLSYLFDRRVALAFYQKPDQCVSLFVMRSDGLDLSAMEKIGVSGKVLCRGDGKGYQVVAWKQKDLLYALVTDKDALALAINL